MIQKRPNTEPELYTMYKRDLERVKDDAFSVALQIRPRGLVEQTRILERLIHMGVGLAREKKIEFSDVLALRDLLWTVRMLMRVCVEKEFTNDRERIEYLAAELAAEEMRGLVAAKAASDMGIKVNA